MRRWPWAVALIILMLSACSVDTTVAPVGVEKQPAQPAAGDPYLNMLRDRVVKYLPKQDGNWAKQTVTYVVGLYRDGRLASIQIKRRSGNDRIDLVGESAIRRASPMPPVPPDFPGDPVVFFTAQLSISSF
jgi:hypothetical protein